MSELLACLRANPVIVAILAGGGIPVFVLGACAFLMARDGLSLKPIAFMAVLMTIVAGPQIAFHVSQAMGWIPERDSSGASARDAARQFVENEELLAAADGRFVDPAAVFGADHDPTLITDMGGQGGGPFEGAEVAQMAVLAAGGTSIVARYPDASGAVRGAERYLVAVVSGIPARASDGTWTFERPAGDAVKVLIAGRTLVAWSGPDEASLEARLAASRIVSVASGDPTAPAAAAAADFWLYRPGVLPTLTVLLVLITVVWFFRGAAWATTIEPVAGVPPVTAQELERRLMAVNDLDVPFSVDAERGRIVASWRFADARWIDLARAHGMRRTHRILMELDAREHTVRPVEQWSLLEASAGVGGASVRWVSAMGVTFYQYEHQRVFGLQVDERGRFVPQLSYAYTFDLQEMKAPIIDAVTRAGWRWRPTMWRGPSWLHWLTS